MKKKIKIKDMPAGKKAKNVKGGLTLLAHKDSAFKIDHIKFDGITVDKSSPLLMKF